MRRKIFTVLMLIWMTVIFLYSAHGSEQSMSDSHEAGELVGGLLMFDFSEDGAAARFNFSRMIEKPIRKCAHVCEYVILGALTLLAIAEEDELQSALEYENIKSRYTPGAGVLAAYAVSVAYAAWDEFHQLFVRGRACLLSDVVIDSIGVMIGVAGILWIYPVFIKLADKEK